MRTTKKRKLLWVIVCVVTVLVTLLTVFTAYLVKNGIGIDVLLYTIAAGTDGSDEGVILDGAAWIAPRLFAQLAVITFFVGVLHVAYYKRPVVLFIRRNRTGQGKKIRLNRAIPCVTLCALLVFYPLYCAKCDEFLGTVLKNSFYKRWNFLLTTFDLFRVNRPR